MSCQPIENYGIVGILHPVAPIGAAYHLECKIDSCRR